MQQYDIQVIKGNTQPDYQDQQGIYYLTKSHRSELRDRMLTQRNCQDICKYKQANSEFYQFSKFHLTKANETTHYQLRKCLIYNKFSNLLIHSSFNRLSFYNPCGYNQRVEIIDDFHIVGLSQSREHILMAGLQSNILFFSLTNVKTSKHTLIQNEDCIVNQADFISNQEILVSDNANQIRIFDVEYLNKEKYLQKCSQAVNHCEICQDLIISCLDQPLVFLFDIKQNKQVIQLKGHQGNNFVARFDPMNSQKVATSGEDKQCLLWDLRKYEKPYYKIDAFTKPFYNILYDGQGQLICIESDDFIQIFNLNKTYLYQIIDYFGQCNGCTFYQDKMYFNIQSQYKMGLFEYNLINNNI